MQLEFINIAVEISPDKMEACLSLEPKGDNTKAALTAELLSDALKESGVCRGVSKNALAEVAMDYNKNPRAYKTDPVAKGVYPVGENSGPIKMQVKYLSDAGDIQKVIGRNYFWEVAQLANKFQRVDNGTVIARRTGGAAPLLGYTVFGETLEPPKNTDDNAGKIHKCGNVFVAGNVFTASETGVVYMRDDGTPDVCPLKFDSEVELNVTPDAMHAELVVYPAGERGVVPTEESLRALLKSKGVVFGIDEEGFMHFLIALRKGFASQISFMVAEGVLPIKGNDGVVEFCFNIDSAPAPTLNADGSADYKNINIVASVAAGATLAKLHPPQPGRAGKDVLGRDRPALGGKSATLPVGTNTAVSKTDPTILVSTIEGIPRYDGATVSVEEGYAIPGDVDYHTGHVNYGHSVVINGDVKSGFNVVCGGDLQVSGIVEDSSVTVGGNVLCKCGFVGTGKGIISAKGDVNLVYCKNQTIISEGSVNIAKEALNCNIKAQNSINIYGQRLSAAGGILVSTGTIVLKTVGNISGVHTILQIDPDPQLLADMKTATAALEHNSENLNKVALTLANLPSEKKRDTEFMRKIKNTAIALKRQVIESENWIRELTVQLEEFKNSFIRIDRLAYPGTEIRFGKRTMLLTDTLIGGKTIRVVDTQITVL